MILQCRMYRSALAIKHYYEVSERRDIEYVAMIINTLVRDMISWDAMFRNQNRDLSECITEFIRTLRVGNGHLISRRSYYRLATLIELMRLDNWDKPDTAKFPVIDKTEDSQYKFMRADGSATVAKEATDLVAMFVSDDAVAFDDTVAAGSMTFGWLCKEVSKTDKPDGWSCTREELLRKYIIDDDATREIYFESNSMVVACHSAVIDVGAWKKWKQLRRMLRH